ncbi:unnamed protein product [Brachionus calyciflorus]|uniref:Protein kinase domain-containing protein n=1 Tax=Brachionus calyciflorus TaxID=104777 RepID=A0A813NNF8_9BILA|nr:unnamed protein product [Brachionus calyciflorus]
MNSPLTSNNNNINNATNKLINTRNTFEELYEYGIEVGKGRYATVKKCYCKRTNKCYAAKIIKNFRTKNNFNLNIIENEITALTLARSHSSIVTLYEVFQTRSETILVLEYAAEKDLHIYLDTEGAFEEEKACEIVYQILKALRFLHSKNVLHLDIKPENVLLMNPLSSRNNSLSSSHNSDHLSSELCQTDNIFDSGEPVKVKLCDFSFSQLLTPGKQIFGMMGTVAYSAPEVIQYDPLTKATDMWSLGVLTYVLLTEYTPFGNGTEKNQTENNILSVREKGFNCTEEHFRDVSLEAQDFIEHLIQFNPRQRLTVEQALNHKWFQKFNMNALSEDIENLNIDNSQRKFVELEIKDRAVYNSTFTSKNTSNKTLSSITNTLIEIKDDKNNNSLSSLIENSNDIKSSSTSSLSSTENCELKQEELSVGLTKQEILNSEYCVLDSLISSSSSTFIRPAIVETQENHHHHQKSNDIKLVSNSYASSST